MQELAIDGYDFYSDYCPIGEDNESETITLELKEYNTMLQAASQLERYKEIVQVMATKIKSTDLKLRELQRRLEHDCINVSHLSEVSVCAGFYFNLSEHKIS